MKIRNKKIIVTLSALFVVILVLASIFIQSSANMPITNPVLTNKPVVIIGTSSISEMIHDSISRGSGKITIFNNITNIQFPFPEDAMIIVDGIWLENQSNVNEDKLANVTIDYIKNGTPIVTIFGNSDFIEIVTTDIGTSNGQATADHLEYSSYGLYINPKTNISNQFQNGYGTAIDLNYAIQDSIGVAYNWCNERLDEKNGGSI